MVKTEVKKKAIAPKRALEDDPEAIPYVEGSLLSGPKPPSRPSSSIPKPSRPAAPAVTKGGSRTKRKEEHKVEDAVSAAVVRVNSSIVRKIQHPGSMEEVPKKPKQPAASKKSKRPEAEEAESVAPPPVCVDATELLKTLDDQKFTISMNPPAVKDTPFSALDGEAIEHQAMYEQMAASIAETPIPKEEDECGKYGPGFVQNLNLPLHTTYEEYIKQTLERQQENLNRLSEEELVSMDEIGVLSRSAQTSSSSSSSSSSSGSKTTKTTRARVVSKMPPVELLPVGSAPLQRFINYVNNTLSLFEPTLQQSVFEAGRVTPNPKKVSAAHVADVLWEAYEPFKPCLNGQMCHCKTDFGFIMMEYVEKTVYDGMVKTGRRPSTMQRSYCYICYLFFVSQDYFNKANGNTTLASILYPFCHVVEQIGEYKKSAMLQSISSYSETNLEDTVAEANYTHTNGTDGNVLPFRRYVVFDFEQCTKGVQNGGTVRGLCEKAELFFSSISPTFDQIAPVAPYHYSRVRVKETSTINILSSLFCLGQTDFTAGRCRMMTNNAMRRREMIRSESEEAYGTVTNFALPQLWCIAERRDIIKCKLDPNQFVYAGFFPWSAIFVADLRETVKKLPELLTCGRIPLVDVLSASYAHEDLAVTADLTTDPAHFAECLQHPAIRCRLLYVAYRLKLKVLNTVKLAYPLSPSSRKDPKLHTRLNIFINWLTQTYGPHLTKDTFDNTVSEELLTVLAATPMAYHFYDTDVHYREVETDLCIRETPAELLAKRFPEKARFFKEFRLLLKEVDTAFARTGSARSVFGDAKFDTHMQVIVELRETVCLVDSAEHSIYLTALYRVNMVLRMHEETLSRVEFAKESEDAAGLKYWRNTRYNLRLFAFTHLNLLQRMYDIDAFSNAAIKARVERGNNYVLRHYDETYPYAGLMPHEGMLPNFAGIIHCVPFPNPATATTRSHPTCSFEVFEMLSVLFPRFQHPKPPVKRNVRLCQSHTSYLSLVTRAVELMLLGAYEHADYMPTFNQCIGIHRTHRSHFDADDFNLWQQQRSAIPILAMREFLVFTVKSSPAYNSYLTYNFPFWVEFSRKVYGSADLVRRLHGSGYHLGISQHAVFTIFKASVDQSTLPAEVRELIEKDNLFEPINFQNVRKKIRVDPLRVLCRKLSNIDKERAKAGMQRAGLTKPMARIIERRVRTIRPGTPIDLAWLQEFNLGYEEPHPHVVITHQTLKLLSLAFFFIGLGEAWSLKADQALMAISLSDYEVVGAFFFHLHIQYCIICFDLDDDTKAKQASAVCGRYHIDAKLAPFMSKSVTSLMFAPCCGAVRSYNAQEFTFPSYGCAHCGIDDSSGRVVDCFSTTAVTAKKKYRIDTLHEGNAKMYLQLGQRKQLESLCERIIAIAPGPNQKHFSLQSKCGTVPILPVPLLGKVVQVTATRISKTGNTEPTTRSYSICTICGAVSNFSVRMFGVNGFNCWCCNVKHTELYFTPKCVFCSASIKLAKKNYYEKMVIDDNDNTGDYTFKKMFVCYHCYKCLTTRYNLHGQYILTAKEMILWKKFVDNGMYKLVIMRSGGDIVDYMKSVPLKPKNVRTNLENPKKAAKRE